MTESQQLLQDNPIRTPYAELELEENPFRSGAWALAGIGVGTGLAAADMLDRFVATRKPEGGQNPWYGAAAAGAQQRRPDAMRLGAQAGGSLVALGAAYLTRGGSVAPWLLSGVALGAGANFVKMLINWYAMPQIFRTQSPTEATTANRLYPLEQSSIQDEIEKFFTSWQGSQALSSNQAVTPVVTGVRNDPTHAAVLAGRPQLPPRTILRTGRLGSCASCGCENGCYSDCPTVTPMPGRPGVARLCSYQVQPDDDIPALAAAANVSLDSIAQLNNGRTEFTAGEIITLPFAMCTYMQHAGPPVAPTRPPPDVTVMQPTASFPTRTAPAPTPPAPPKKPRFSVPAVPDKPKYDITSEGAFVRGLAQLDVFSQMEQDLNGAAPSLFAVGARK